MDLFSIRPTGKTSIKNSVSVYVITKEGKNYTSEGIEFIQNGLKEHFNVDTDLAVYTGIALNSASVLSSFIRKKPDSYVVLSTRDQVGFLSPEANELFCLNLDEHPNKSSWEILMESCNRELY